MSRVLLSAFCFAAVLLTDLYGADGRPDEVIEAASAACSWVTHSAITSQVSYTWRGGHAPSFSSQSLVKQFRDSDERIHVKLDVKYIERDGKPERVGQSLPGEHILAAGRHVVHVPGVRVQLARTTEDFDKWRRLLGSDARFGAFLEGRLPAVNPEYLTVFDLARSGAARIASHSESIGGIQCVRLEADTASAQLRLWVAPDFEYRPVRYEIKGTAQDGTDVYDYTIVVDQLKFGEVEEHAVAVSGRYRFAYLPRAESQPAYEELIEIERIQVDLDPNFDDPTLFSFSGIKDGTPAVVEDTPGIQFTWRDGDAVAAVDAESLAMIRGQVAEQHVAKAPFEVPLFPAWGTRVGIIIGASLVLLALWFGVERWLLPRLRANRGG